MAGTQAKAQWRVHPGMTLDGPVDDSDCILVRWIPVDAWAGPLKTGEGWLSDAERQRGERFRPRVLRDRYVASHVFLRETLGAYLGCHPADIAYSQGPWGKPSIRRPSHGIHFSLAHSENMIVVAISPRAQVGVDIERARSKTPWAEFASLFMSASELAAWEACDGSRRGEVAAGLWTRKEALAKAEGRGLAMDLRSIDTGRCAPDSWPDPGWALVAAAGRRWWVAELPVDTSWVGALAVEAGARDDISPRVDLGPGRPLVHER